jgi:hypothetical protein
MAGNATEGIIDKIFGQGSRISSIQRVNCKQCNTNSVEAIVIVFDDGQTSVSCPAERGNHTCHYEIKPRPTAWYNRKWFLYIIFFIFFLVAIAVDLINTGKIKF